MLAIHMCHLCLVSHVMRPHLGCPIAKKGLTDLTLPISKKTPSILYSPIHRAQKMDLLNVLFFFIVYPKMGQLAIRPAEKLQCVTFRA